MKYSKTVITSTLSNNSMNLLFSDFLSILHHPDYVIKRTAQLLIFFLLAFFATTGQGLARTKEFDKTIKEVESKYVEITSRQFDCQISFSILIDNETSRKDVYMRFAFYAKKPSFININGNLLLGCKGDPRYEYELYRQKRGRTDNYYSMVVWYPLEDLEGIFDCNKARLQTVTGNIDIELTRSQMKDLRRFYENAVESATHIYRTNTDITYMF